METLRPDPSWFEIDPAFYRHGGSCLNTAEAEAIDTRPGQSVLVTPPGSGEEAISLANLGARVTVLGSEPALRQARELAGRAGVSLAFSEGDAANPEVPGDPFDAVYSPWGALDALADFEPWAAAVARLLHPGGRLVIYDRHPISSIAAVHNGLFLIGHSYFDDDLPGANGWTLADLVSALGAEGLATMLFDEFPGSERFHTPLDRLGVRWDIRWRLPGAMLLVAIRVH